jgi:uncharacterized SAM-dependent methyltransferase
MPGEDRVYASRFGAEERTQREGIWTENSYKFTRESVAQDLEAAGLQLNTFYTNEDPKELFGLALAARA